ncbi:hypothetical protein D3C73_1217070 [compost metagenome]
MNVVPALGDHLKTQGEGGLTQLIQQEFAVGVVEHADASGLWQQGAGQAQLAVQWWIAP